MAQGPMQKKTAEPSAPEAGKFEVSPKKDSRVTRPSGKSTVGSNK